MESFNNMFVLGNIPAFVSSPQMLVLGIVFLGFLIAIIVLLMRATNYLKKFGCVTGSADEVVKKIRDTNASGNFIQKLREGQVSNNKDKEDALEAVFGREKKPFLFYSMLGRFIARPAEKLEEQPSLQSLSVEFATISKIQWFINAAKCLSSILPALGLCGTLWGMYAAFTGSDFQDPSMQDVMTGLMQDFGTALWSTIIALFTKLGSDVYSYFIPQSFLSILTNELVQLKYHVLDIIEQKLPLPVQESAKDTGTERAATEPEKEKS